MVYSIKKDLMLKNKDIFILFHTYIIIKDQFFFTRSVPSFCWWQGSLSSYGRSHEPQHLLTICPQPIKFSNKTFLNRNLLVESCWCNLKYPQLFLKQTQDKHILTAFSNPYEWSFKHILCWFFLKIITRVLTIRVGVTKVKQGFSIPPKGKEGGSTSRSYWPQI